MASILLEPKTTLKINTMNHPMKKHRKVSRNLSLGDLILAVSSVSKNSRETVAAVADLLESGQVRLQSRGHQLRARVL